MKKIFKFCLLVSVLYFGYSCSVFAQSQDFPNNSNYQNYQGYERINSFVSDITVNTDSSINVVENIKYNSGGMEKHGIYRDIRLKSYNNKNLKISDISVTDQNNIPYKYTKDFSSGKVSLKIGDSGVTFSGDKTYVIKYKIKQAIGYFDKYDEIYWNATGNSWTFPIESIFASVHLPSGASLLQSSSYCGYSGSNDPCTSDGKGNFSYNNEIFPGSGMTVAVGFTKSIVRKPNFFDSLDLSDYIFILLPILTLIIMFVIWNKYGRDPKSNRTIIAEYDVPDNLTPLEVSGVVKQKVDSKAISAEIIFLAINGFLRIEKTEEKNTSLTKSDNYTLKRISKNFPSDETDKILIGGLFSTLSPILGSIVSSDETNKLSDEVKMSTLKNQFYIYISKISKNVFNKLVNNKYLKNSPQNTPRICYIIAIIILCFGLPIGSAYISEYGYTSIISVIITSIILFVFGGIMSSRTEKGVLTKEYLLGLKEYLDIAEKDRINFHNAPAKKPEIFEKFLPYAMIFGVEKAWAKEFDGIYKESPKWYVDNNMSAFNTIMFVNSLNNFTTYSNSMISSIPGSSGSNGGGFVGGGGGGGGGGSW
jgi:uncharacterized membrane protein